MKKETVDEIKNLSRICFYFILVLYFITGYVGTIYKIEGSSMNPLLLNTDRVISDRLVYKMSDIRRGDVVVFHAPAQPRKYFIKRIIGLPGETIEIRRGSIYVGNQRVDDSYIPEEYRTTEDLEPTIIPLGFYFVVGDHRNVSDDSRTWACQNSHWPFVPERYIQGKIRCIIWPLNRIKTIPSLNLAPAVDS
ncbi:signal peptidase I [bacterium]|nr:signal peptidase I [candidate division CSSED10-310 bacterium]